MNPASTSALYISGGKAKKLSEIVRNKQLPLTVEFESKRRWNFRIGSHKYSSRDFGELRLEDVQPETFLKVNTIHEGEYSHGRTQDHKYSTGRTHDNTTHLGGPRTVVLTQVDPEP